MNWIFYKDGILREFEEGLLWFHLEYMLDEGWKIYARPLGGSWRDGVIALSADMSV